PPPAAWLHRPRAACAVSPVAGVHAPRRRRVRGPPPHVSAFPVRRALPLLRAYAPPPRGAAPRAVSAPPAGALPPRVSVFPVRAAVPLPPPGAPQPAGVSPLRPLFFP